MNHQLTRLILADIWPLRKQSSTCSSLLSFGSIKCCISARFNSGTFATVARLLCGFLKEMILRFSLIASWDYSGGVLRMFLGFWLMSIFLLTSWIYDLQILGSNTDSTRNERLHRQMSFLCHSTRRQRFCKVNISGPFRLLISIQPATSDNDETRRNDYCIGKKPNVFFFCFLLMLCTKSLWLLFK